MLLIRPATQEDHDAIWQILEPTIRAGETYALPRDMSKDDGLTYWTGPDRQTFVADQDGQTVGTYYLRANQLGGGAHVANCAYMTAGLRDRTRRLAQHVRTFVAVCSRAWLPSLQFNFVISTNERAIRLWQDLGFEIVGRLPLAFLHPRGNYADALVMFQTL